MGSFGGAELCQLVSLYVPHILGEKYEKNRIGLYRDDGLACLGYASGPQADRIRKDFIKIFKEDYDFTNWKAVNLVDVTLIIWQLVNTNLVIHQIIIHCISTFFLTILQI